MENKNKSSFITFTLLHKGSPPITFNNTNYSHCRLSKIFRNLYDIRLTLLLGQFSLNLKNYLSTSIYITSDNSLI